MRPLAAFKLGLIAELSWKALLSTESNEPISDRHPASACCFATSSRPISDKYTGAYNNPTHAL